MYFFQKNILMLMLLGLMSLTQTLAQTDKDYASSPAERAAKQIERMKTELNLSDTQTKSLQAALEERITKARAATTKAEKQAANKAFRETLKATLSEEQLAQLKAQKAERKEQREAFTEKLDLSEEQKAQMQEARTEMREKMEALREEKAKSREARKTLREEHRDTVKEILTPEQFAIWEAEIEKRKRERKGKRGRKGE